MDTYWTEEAEDGSIIINNSTANLLTSIDAIINRQPFNPQKLNLLF